MASTHAWMNLSGRHKVSVGSSLGKAIKARKGAPAAPKRSNLPERDFYSFRYNFKPESIDPTKPGTVEVKKVQEKTTVRVERPTAVPNLAQVFYGEQRPTKEFDCILIYDEDLGTFTLEKLDSYANLNYDGREAMKTRVSASPHTRLPVRSAADELEAELLEGLADADGEPDIPLPVPKPVPKTMPKVAAREEEEEEEEDVPIAARVDLTPTKPKPPPPKPKAAPKKALAPSLPGPKAKALPKAKAKAATAKRPREGNDVEEFTVSRAPPAKKARPSTPPPPPSFSLALPTSDAGPDPLARLASYAPAAKAAAPPPPPQAVDSDDEGEWDEVAALPLPLTIEEEDDEEAEEIDVSEFQDALELALDQELSDQEGDGIFEEEVGYPIAPAPPAGGPISLNAFAGGVVDDDDDDYSSSDDDED
ncbi:hypothetical protein FA95DRAFT_1241971 [Auriscalpium vulgare]|uniref:Uncharacterized protein n=1 Tax=Auriscalpium vulgare TaxID=40419 RepID=A0ACB8S861_9AGAM|nr:hypothetical protein FA95DRAFT_1241971 [Auriscalpium vulgare]